MTTTQHHGLGPTRAQVLSLLQSAPTAKTVGDIADELGLHKNSARFHLDALVSAGYAAQAVESNGTQGRPPLLYTATATAPTLNSTHLLELIDVLLTNLCSTSPDSRAAAVQAGHLWGSRVATPETAADDVTTQLTQHLAERGFGVEPHEDTLLLRRCPFRSAVAPDRLPLVCAIHQGFLDGYLETAGGTVHAEELEVGPEICSVRLTEVPPAH